MPGPTACGREVGPEPDRAAGAPAAPSRRDRSSPGHDHGVDPAARARRDDRHVRPGGGDRRRRDGGRLPASTPSSTARSRSSSCRRSRPATPRSSSGSTRRGERPPSSTTRTSPGSTASARTARIHYIAFEYIEGVTIRQRVDEQRAARRSARRSTSRSRSPTPWSTRPGAAWSTATSSRRTSSSRRRGGPSSSTWGWPAGSSAAADHGLTQSGMTLGHVRLHQPRAGPRPARRRRAAATSTRWAARCSTCSTGRPPFPDGTVLQKLLQHQEEPPADVRTLNPEVPGRPRAIITKLMAKDRDRRYQAPEQLVRDLLTVAGSLGLERKPTELEAWMVHDHHRWWERHLAWFLPAVGFIVMMSGLAWWGREFSKPPTASRSPAADSPTRSTSQLNLADPTGPRVPSIAPKTVGGESQPSAGRPCLAMFSVKSSDNLLDVLAGATRRSIIVLADDGPYRLGGRAWSTRAAAPRRHRRGHQGGHGSPSSPEVRRRCRVWGRTGLLRSSISSAATSPSRVSSSSWTPWGRANAPRPSDARIPSWTLRGCSFRHARRPSRVDRNRGGDLRPGDPTRARAHGGHRPCSPTPAISTAARSPCGPRGPRTSR